MDWKALLRNKPALAGLGAAAALGAWTLYQRSRGDSAGPVDDESTSGGVGGVGSFDSTGTDVANWLGNYSGSLQTQMDEFLNSIRDELGNMPTNPTQPAPTKPITTQPVTRPIGKIPGLRPAVKTPAYVTVGKYTKTNTAWNSTLSGIAKRYKTSVSTLLKLNPSVKNPNVIRTGQKIRVS
ncbi:LysM peptidoglycan-binding domain-containing protein [Phytohabitans rumicis]|uniref:LysM domain-containing protein n=1 Tax=Phytohabitans rumicis TaxID=1076125 RepID=A0A6V8LCH8_9ACTN|nr:LysM domain-containing protein [Phytohabitans rumicis]GFJ92481.1 hypothetical protein Prum_061230 [Phytohabitans rumicis]